jgi:maltose O-acetyltransferase
MEEPQFKDSGWKIVSRHGLSFSRIFFNFVYYNFLKWFPDPPMIGGKLWIWLRTRVCRHIFKKCGKDIKINTGVVFGSGVGLVLGDYTALNRDAWIAHDTVFGDHVMMGPEVIILSGSHNFDRTDIPMRCQGAPSRRPVRIGDDVWIGTRAIILPGVKVGDHVIIGAGSIVTKDIPDWAIAAGNPARVIRYRNEK